MAKQDRLAGADFSERERAQRAAVKGQPVAKARGASSGAGQRLMKARVRVEAGFLRASPKTARSPGGGRAHGSIRRGISESVFRGQRDLPAPSPRSAAHSRPADCRRHPPGAPPIPPEPGSFLPLSFPWGANAVSPGGKASSREGDKGDVCASGSQ